MATQYGLRQHEQHGAALFTSFILFFSCVVMAAALLECSMKGAKVTNDSTDRIQALMLAKSGLSIAVAKLRTGTSAQKINGLTAEWGLEKQYSYSVQASVLNDGNIQIISTGKVLPGVERWDFQPGSLGSRKQEVTRIIEAIFTPVLKDGSFSAAVFGTAGLSGGGGFTVDSFDALKGDYLSQVAKAPAIQIGKTGDAWPAGTFTAGSVDAYRRSPEGSKGNILSQSGISLGSNSYVYGDARPGYSSDPTTVYAVTGNGKVFGSTAPLTFAQTLSAPYIPDVSDIGFTTPLASGYIKAGTYHWSSWSQSPGDTLKLPANGVVNVVVDGAGSIDLKGVILLDVGSKINIFMQPRPESSKNGGSITFCNAGAPTETRCNDFNIVSGSDSTITYTGSAKFMGTVYAPFALLNATGGMELYGAVACKDFTFKGGATVHYDIRAVSPGILSTLKVQCIRELDTLMNASK